MFIEKLINIPDKIFICALGVIGVIIGISSCCQSPMDTHKFKAIEQNAKECHNKTCPEGMAPYIPPHMNLECFCAIKAK